MEISNGNQIVTVFRQAKSLDASDSRLITVYYSSLESIYDNETIKEDMYVNRPNSSTSHKGFHTFLEELLTRELPQVLAADGKYRKLYLQLIFSAMFIEQKQGWSGIFSGMPTLGIRESKRKVVEFILNLGIMKYQAKRDKLQQLYNDLELDWKVFAQKLEQLCNENQIKCSTGISKPRIITKEEIESISFTVEEITLDQYKVILEEELDKLNKLTPKVVDNFEKLNEELTSLHKSIYQYEQQLNEEQKGLNFEFQSQDKISNNLKLIEIDLSNNQDAKILRDYGSKLDLSTSKDQYPLCNQKIADILLSDNYDKDLMSIEDNIKHLKAQREMLAYAKSKHEENIKILESSIAQNEHNLIQLRGMARIIRSDLFSVNDSYSETIVYKKIEINRKLDNVAKIEKTLEVIKTELSKLVDRWSYYLTKKEELKSYGNSESDSNKIQVLCNKFITNLRLYGYKSIQNLSDGKVTISEETLLPNINGFDMKFDSSASDNIRVIWAYTMALLQTSTQIMGNHFNIIIYDEPAQHSIVTDNLYNFLILP